jgi:hypothetical protein
VIESEIGVLFRIYCYGILNCGAEACLVCGSERGSRFYLSIQRLDFYILAFCRRCGRMLHSVRGEPSRFDMVPGNVEDLDRAVNEMDNVLTTGLFQVIVSFSTTFDQNTAEDLVNFH